VVLNPFDTPRNKIVRRWKKPVLTIEKEVRMKETGYRHDLEGLPDEFLHEPKAIAVHSSKA
jgi:hypothetical protein